MRTKYQSLPEFRAAKIQARQERDGHAKSIADRWAKLQDPATRGILLRDAAGDVLHGWKPYRQLHDLMHGRISGPAVSAIGMAVAAAQRGFPKRLLFSGASALLGRFVGNDGLDAKGLLASVATAVGGLFRRSKQDAA